MCQNCLNKVDDAARMLQTACLFALTTSAYNEDDREGLAGSLNMLQLLAREAVSSGACRAADEDGPVDL